MILPMRITGPLFAIIGVGSLWMAWLMGSERLPRNGLVGMRTRATMASDAAWNAAHRASAWSIALTGLVLLVGGIWLLLDRRSPESTRNVVLGISLAVLAVVVIGGVQADRVAKGTTSASGD